MITNLSRRRLLKGALAGAAGLAGASLIGCDAGSAAPVDKPYGATVPGLAADGTLTSTATPTPTPTQEPPLAIRLRDLADRRGITVGSAIETGAGSFVDDPGAAPVYRNDLYHRDPRYRSVFEREFNLATPGGEFRWQWLLRPSRSSFNFARIDELGSRAKSQGQKFRGHLIDGHDIPPWLRDGQFSSETLKQILAEHVSTVMAHCHDIVDEWTVVNEPITNRVAHDFWDDNIGHSYVEYAFEVARSTNPDAILLMNHNNNHQAGMLNYDISFQLASQLKTKKLIDGIGMQMHIGQGGQPSPTKERVLATMLKYAGLGVPVYITELDVNIYDGIPGVTSDQLTAQATIYREMLEALIECGVGRSYTVWGFTDATSWLLNTNSSRGGEAPCLFDREFNPKPAYYAVRDTLARS